MNDPSRRLVYRLFIVLAVAMACGRILSAELLYEPSQTLRPWPKTRPTAMPTFGSNDRSRWATIRSLLKDGKYDIGQRDRNTVLATAGTPMGLMDPWQVTAASYAGYQLRTGTKAKLGIDTNTGIIFEDGWESVDKVLDPATLKFYSSKPPLLATLVAGLCWLMQMLFGWTLQSHPGAVVRTILLLVNAGTFAVYLVMLARVVERYGRTDFGRYFVLAAGAFGTMMTPFQITLNNHTLATVCVLGALMCAIKIWEGVQSALAAGLRLNGDWRFYCGAGLLSACAVTNELPALAFAAALFLVLLAISPRWTLLAFLPPALLVAAAFFFTNYLAVGSWRPVNTDFGSPWYSFEGSHFRIPNPGEQRTGIDFASYKESRAEYAFHLLLGHHGWFSLAPIWMLALLSLVRAWRERNNTSLPRFLPVLTLAVSLVVFAFYLMKTDNYGGWTNGPRWLMWLTPLWLIALLPMADRLGLSRVGRWLALLCLGMSVLSAHYSMWNPWRHPWIYDLMLSCGWEGY